MDVITEDNLYGVLLYNLLLNTKISSIASPLYMTHFVSICQSGMTHPINYGSIANNQGLEVNVSQNTNIGGYWYRPITNLHKSLLLPLSLTWSLSLTEPYYTSPLISATAAPNGSPNKTKKKPTKSWIKHTILVEK